MPHHHKLSGYTLQQKVVQWLDCNNHTQPVNKKDALRNSTNDTIYKIE